MFSLPKDLYSELTTDHWSTPSNLYTCLTDSGMWCFAEGEREREVTENRKDKIDVILRHTGAEQGIH